MADGCSDKYTELLTGKSHKIIETTKSGDVDALKALVDACEKEGRAFNVCDGSGWQAVHYACQRDDPVLVRVLLEADPRLIHSKTYEDVTPLIVAAGEGRAEVVQFLLESLGADDLKVKTIHGMNALYYAVDDPDPIKAERVAELLLNKCSSPDVMQLFHGSECVPYAMLRQKSLDLLNLFLRFGLITTYQTHEPECWPDKFHELNLPSASYPPADLAAYCVHLDWSDGLQTIIDWHRKRLSGELAPGVSSCPFTDGSTPLMDMLNYQETDPYETTYSAWALSLLLGRLNCFRLMLDAGLTMMDYCHCTMPCDDCEIRYYFPLALALSQDVSQRKEFVDCLIKLQLAEAFEEEFVRFLSSDVAEPDAGFDCWIERLIHPVEAIVNLGDESPNTFTPCLAVLRECGFGFDFDLIPYNTDDASVDWHNTASFLLQSMLYAPRHHGSALTLFVDLVCRRNELTIGPEAVVLSLPANRSHLREELTSLHENADGLDFTQAVLRSLSLLPAERIRSVYDNVMVTSNDCLRCCIRTGEPRGDESRVLEYPCPNPANALIFLTKGFRVVLSDSPVLCNPPDGHLPAALTFLSSRDRARHIRAALDDADAETRQRYRQHLPDSEVDSLMSLCRAEIRRCLGPARLLKEPPVSLNKETQTSKWELSSIDLLPGLPNPIKNYLKYADDVQAYAAEWSLSESGVTD